MAQTSYRPQLDGVRAICILFTFVHHLPGHFRPFNGSVGVDVFFALSGWLITRLLLEERRGAGRIDLGGFYIRRVFRILPLYYLICLFYVAAALLAARMLGASGELAELARVAPYILSFNAEYQPEVGDVMFGHAWTLGIEEKFYFAWPALLLVSFRRPAAAALLTVATAGCLLLIGGGSGFVVRGYAGLAAGAGLALLLWYSGPIERVFAQRSLALPILALIALAYGMSLSVPLGPLWNVVIGALAAPLIASLWFAERQWLSHMLSVRWLAWLGRRTYAIYLIHTLAINATEVVLARLGASQGAMLLFVCAYPLSIAAAWLLGIVVERPCIALGRRIARGRAAKAGAETA